MKRQLEINQLHRKQSPNKRLRRDTNQTFHHMEHKIKGTRHPHKMKEHKHENGDKENKNDDYNQCGIQNTNQETTNDMDTKPQLKAERIGIHRKRDDMYHRHEKYNIDEDILLKDVPHFDDHVKDNIIGHRHLKENKEKEIDYYNQYGHNNKIDYYNQYGHKNNIDRCNKNKIDYYNQYGNKDDFYNHYGTKVTKDYYEQYYDTPSLSEETPTPDMEDSESISYYTTTRRSPRTSRFTTFDGDKNQWMAQFSLAPYSKECISPRPELPEKLFRYKNKLIRMKRQLENNVAHGQNQEHSQQVRKRKRLSKETDQAHYNRHKMKNDKINDNIKENSHPQTKKETTHHNKIKENNIDYYNVYGNKDDFYNHYGTKVTKDYYLQYYDTPSLSEETPTPDMEDSESISYYTTTRRSPRTSRFTTFDGNKKQWMAKFSMTPHSKECIQPRPKSVKNLYQYQNVYIRMKRELENNIIDRIRQEDTQRVTKRKRSTKDTDKIHMEHRKHTDNIKEKNVHHIVNETNHSNKIKENKIDYYNLYGNRNKNDQYGHYETKITKDYYLQYYDTQNTHEETIHDIHGEPGVDSESISYYTTTRRSPRTSRFTTFTADKNQWMAHFSIAPYSNEHIPPKTERVETPNVNDAALFHDVNMGRVTQDTTPFQYDHRVDISSESEMVPETTQHITCLPYRSGEDLFEYYLRNVSQGITTDKILTWRRIRLPRTSPQPHRPGFGRYDHDYSVTSCPGYFDDSLGQLVDEYVDSVPMPNSSEIARWRARDAALLQAAKERSERGQGMWSDGFDESIWRQAPIITSVPPRSPSTATISPSPLTDDMYDYVLRNKKRRRVGPAEPIMRTLITKDPYEMFERLFGKVTTGVNITFSQSVPPPVTLEGPVWHI